MLLTFPDVSCFPLKLVLKSTCRKNKKISMTYNEIYAKCQAKGNIQLKVFKISICFIVIFLTRSKCSSDEILFRMH